MVDDKAIAWVTYLVKEHAVRTDIHCTKGYFIYIIEKAGRCFEFEVCVEL